MMIKIFVRCAMFGFVLLSSAASADPIKLKLAFFSSDRSLLYSAAIKPFVDAVNAEAKGVLEIDVHFSGALGRDPVQQVQLILDGSADIAFVAPGYTPNLFRDNVALELPGMFRNAREATLVFTRLIAAKALTGYEEFVVIGALSSEPETIHTRPAVASLGDLSGKTIRVNNLMEAAALEKLGMLPVLMPVNQISDALIGGKLDGAAVPPAMLFEFGIGRAASHHFFLRTSTAPLTLLMNRKTFENLPAQGQDIIRRYGGEWAAARFVDSYVAVNSQSEEKLKSDPRRKLVFPSQSDLDTAEVAYKAVTEEWLAKAPRNRELLKMVKMEIAKLREAR
jgi:TRAP-type C4-dicarboxylate transport system substrate-binding protein